MNLKEELANEYALRYVERVKYLITGIKEKWLKKENLEEDLEELTELSTQALNRYSGTNDLLDLYPAISYISYRDATLDTLESLRVLEGKRLPKVIKSKLLSLPYYSIKFLSQNRP